MKLKLTLIITLFVWFNTNAQTTNCSTLKAKDLLFLFGKDINDFDSFARSKCYTHRRSGDLGEKGGQEHDYQFRQGEVDNGDYVRFAQHNDGGKFIAYLTLSEEKFKSLKDEMPSIGFKFVKSRFEDKILYYTFESSTMVFSISQYPSGFKYHFSVYKK